MKLNNFVLSFQQYILNERVLSIGLNPKHEKYREQHRQEIHDMIQKSYEKLTPVAGYCGHKPGSKEESDAIHADISNPHHIIKATRRNGKITAIHLYKKKYGRKAIGVATNGTEQGKKDDHKMKRAWGRVLRRTRALTKEDGIACSTQQSSSQAHRQRDRTTSR